MDKKIWTVPIGSKKYHANKSNRNGRDAHLYWFKKKHCWLWFAVDREQRKYLDFVVGSRGTITGQELWNKVKDKATGKVMTDYWKAYKEMITTEQLIQTKKEIYTVESYNGLLRHYIARFRRRTKCYSKSLEMLNLTVKLFIYKRNNWLSIFSY